MPAFIVQGGVRADGSWVFDVTVSNGDTVVHSDVMRLLALAQEFYSRAPNQRALTVGEVAALRAERALPDGWEATPDGTSTTLTDGTVAYSRSYQRGDEVCVAPCDAQGNPIAETRATLLAYDTHPPVPEA